jgi:glycerophosphoryl diester phosphodiesterase
MSSPLEIQVPQLVAHRGWISRYPENTLPALAAAIAAGARWLEIDVQLNAEGRPYLFHDRDLSRTTGRGGALGDLTNEELATLDAGESRRLGDAFTGTALPELAVAVELIATHAQVGLFVELKRVSIERFGPEAVLDAVLPVLAPLAGRWLPISFDTAVLRAARRRGVPSIGWVMESWDEAGLATARELDPCFLFADRKILPATDALPAGPWHWAVYAVNDASEAKERARNGMSFVETDSIGELLEDPELAAWGRP